MTPVRLACILLVESSMALGKWDPDTNSDRTARVGMTTYGTRLEDADERMTAMNTMKFIKHHKRNE
jgi:hypothetical protein